MPPNLRSVVSQGWRSIGSRRNFSSSRGSNGERLSLYEAMKASLYPSFTTFRLGTWSLYGYAFYAGIEAYQIFTITPEVEKLAHINFQQKMKRLSEPIKK